MHHSVVTGVKPSADVGCVGGVRSEAGGRWWHIKSDVNRGGRAVVAVMLLLLLLLLLLLQLHLLEPVC